MNVDIPSKSVSFAIALAIFGLAIGAMPNPASAQSRDRCHDFANEMSSIDQRAQQLQCKPWTKKRVAYDVNYNWCQSASPATVQDATNRWQSEFQRCQFQASGAPAAQPQRPVAQPARPAPQPTPAAQKLPDGPGCPAPGSVRSVNTNQRAIIRFVNSSHETLRFYWVNFNGQMVFERELKHGYSYDQATNMRNLWVAANASGGCFEPYQPERVGENRIDFR
ncbi:MAG: hypothetical protein ACRCUE_01135 [Bosea sp. (in: a-proteobacteria)]